MALKRIIEPITSNGAHGQKTDLTRGDSALMALINRAITFASMNDEPRAAINRATDAATMAEVLAITNSVRAFANGFPSDTVYRAIDRSVDANQ
jgi:hypothetical protein